MPHTHSRELFVVWCFGFCLGIQYGETQVKWGGEGYLIRAAGINNAVKTGGEERENINWV